MAEDVRPLTTEQATLLRPFFDELDAAHNAAAQSQLQVQNAQTRLGNALALVLNEAGWTFDIGRRVFSRTVPESHGES